MGFLNGMISSTHAAAVTVFESWLLIKVESIWSQTRKTFFVFKRNLVDIDGGVAFNLEEFCNIFGDFKVGELSVVFHVEVNFTVFVAQSCYRITSGGFVKLFVEEPGYHIKSVSFVVFERYTKFSSSF